MTTTRQTHCRTFAVAIASAAAAATLVGVGVARAGGSSSPPPDEVVDVGRLITVNGTGTVTIEPDRAIAHFAVNASSPSGAAAMDEVNAHSNAVVDALLATGITEDDIATNLSLREVWDDDYERVIGYEASLDVSVTIDGIDEDPARVGEVLDTAHGVGGDGFTIGGVSFTYADMDALRAQAEVAAGADARRSAEAIAQGAGATVGDVVTISVGGTWTPPVVYEDVAAAPASAEAPPAPVLAGDLDFSITVTATFELG